MAGRKGHAAVLLGTWRRTGGEGACGCEEWQVAERGQVRSRARECCADEEVVRTHGGEWPRKANEAFCSV